MIYKEEFPFKDQGPIFTKYVPTFDFMTMLLVDWPQNTYQDIYKTMVSPLLQLW